jgi:hypothetical protein
MNSKMKLITLINMLLVIFGNCVRTSGAAAPAALPVVVFDLRWGSITMPPLMRDEYFVQGKKLAGQYQEIKNKCQNIMPTPLPHGGDVLTIALDDGRSIDFNGNVVDWAVYPITFAVNRIDIIGLPQPLPEPKYIIKYGKNGEKSREWLIEHDKVDTNKIDTVNKILNEIEYSGLQQEKDGQN